MGMVSNPEIELFGICIRTFISCWRRGGVTMDPDLAITAGRSGIYTAEAYNAEVLYSDPEIPGTRARNPIDHGFRAGGWRIDQT